MTQIIKSKIESLTQEEREHRTVCPECKKAGQDILPGCVAYHLVPDLTHESWSCVDCDYSRPMNGKYGGWV